MTAAKPITTSQPRNLSWKDVVRMPVLFVTTLLEPLFDKQGYELIGRQIVDVKNEVQKKGVRAYVWQMIKERPLEVASRVGIVCTVGSGIAGSEAGGALMVASTVLRTIDIFGTSALLMKKTASSIKGDTWAAKGMKVSLYGGIVYLAASLPAAAAAEWDSLAQARAHYSHPCQPSLGNLMKPAGDCFEKGGASMEQCRALVPADMSHDLSVFARHATQNGALDPVSITKFQKDRVCFFTALDQQTGVTKLCFPDMNNLDVRTVEKVSSMPLSKAHEGLQPGDTVVLLEVTQGGANPRTCASFTPWKLEEGVKPTTCVLTALEKDGPVSQICLSPAKPEVLTLRALPGVQLDQPGQSGPVSILVRDPKTMGLNVAPDVPCPSKPKTFSLWDALSLWWTGKSPCDKNGATINEKDL